MKTRQGFTSTTVLLVMSILFLKIIYLIHTTLYQDLILTSTANSIQSYYLSEDKTLMTVYDEKYYDKQLYPLLLDIFRSNRFSTNRSIIRLDEEDLSPDDDTSYVRVTFKERNNRMEMILESNSNYKGLRTQIFASGPVVNHLFEKGNPILNISTIDNVDLMEFNRLLEGIVENISTNYNSIPNTMYAMEYLNYQDIILHKKDYVNFEILGNRDTMENPYKESSTKKEYFLICKNINGETINLSLGHPDKPNEELSISGLIYVEGNVIISSKLTFNGIIIVKDGDIILNSNDKPKINGLLITDNVGNILDIKDDLNLSYNSKIVYKFGTFLPGFFEPIINLIKST